jgi:hypothetical protein
MTIVRLCVLAVALVLLGACGSIPGLGSDKAPSITDIATKANCAVITASPSEHAAEEGSCDDYTIATFTSAENRDKWLKSAEGVGGPYLVGDLWVVAGDERAALEQLKGALGGEVRG